MDSSGSGVPSIQPWKNPNKSVTEVELSKSLALLGFGSWTSLEPSNYKNKENRISRLQFYFIRSLTKLKYYTFCGLGNL